MRKSDQSCLILKCSVETFGSAVLQRLFCFYYMWDQTLNFWVYCHVFWFLMEVYRLMKSNMDVHMVFQWLSGDRNSKTNTGFLKYWSTVVVLFNTWNFLFH